MYRDSPALAGSQWSSAQHKIVNSGHTTEEEVHTNIFQLATLLFKQCLISIDVSKATILSLADNKVPTKSIY